MENIPLVIIGAGPAGLSTALHLLQRDASWKDQLVILEKAQHPRHKLCGGGLTRLGLDVLQGLGLPARLPVAQARVEDVRLSYFGRVIHVRGRPEFVVFHRPEFDAYLAETARARGVQILENQAATKITWQADGVRVSTSQTEYLAQAVVGADGSKGLARRAVGQRGRVARLLEVVRPVSPTDAKFEGRYAQFDFSGVGEGVQGYVWDFPVFVGGQAHANRGVYDARFWADRPRAQLPALLSRSLQQWGDGEAGAFEGHPIHLFSPGNRLSAERIVLVGDAAGVDPLFGEGIGPALAYGQAAARSVAQAFARDDFSFRDYGRQVLFSRLGRYLLLRWWTAGWVYRLGRQAGYMHWLWTVGGVLAALKRG